MKNTLISLLFDQEFRSNVSRELIKKNKDLKSEDSDRSFAMRLAYVLKFKQKELPEIASGINFDDIRHKSLKHFNENKPASLFLKKYIQIAVAASVILLVGIAGYLVGESHFFFGYVFQSKVIEFNTPKGQQSELTLPDGTFVALNYDSKLKYRLSSTSELQEVELDGEAYFEVTKDQSRTFRVITNDMDVNVLGTEFNVRAYKNDLHTETTLLGGSVEIKNITNNNGSVLLKPGEKWSFDKTNFENKVIPVESTLSTLWRNGEYYFEKISFGELAGTLERMYNVHIQFEDESLKNEVFSGSVYKKDEITKLFEIINLTVAIDAEIEDNQILIKRR